MNYIVYLLLFTFMISSCASYPTYNDPIPKHESIKITSKFIEEERVINIWTPPNYAESMDSLPVLYMPDGGIKEDFPHIANSLASLIEAQKIPPIILVGIENTERGRDLTGASQVEEHKKYNIPMTDGANNFRAFITKELIPEINTRYKTTPKKGIIGESLAGLFVMETFFLQPEIFNFYIAMDPSLWWNGNYLVNNAEKFLNNLPDRNTKLWFAGSEAKDISKYTKQLAEKLEEVNSDRLILKYSDEPKEKHHTIFRATKEKALIWIMNESE